MANRRDERSRAGVMVRTRSSAHEAPKTFSSAREIDSGGTSTRRGTTREVERRDGDRGDGDRGNEGHRGASTARRLAETSARRRMGRGTRAETWSSDDDDGIAAVADVLEESSRGGDKRPARRFIEPAKMMRYLEANERYRRGVGSKSGRARSFLMSFILGMTPNDGLNARRFYTFMYFSAALILENYLMVRGVRTSEGNFVPLQATENPGKFLRGLYTRYLPLATFVDLFVVVTFFNIDSHGRPILYKEDIGMIFRLVIKTIMRHPAVSLTIIGYNYPGHTFTSKQIVLLLLSPEIVPMTILDAYDGLLAIAVLCFTNFALYPTFFIGISRALPVYRAQTNLQFNAHAWLGVTFAPLVCFTLKKVQRHLCMRNSVSVQGTLDSFFVRHGALFQIWRRATCSFTLDRYEEQVERRANGDARVARIEMDDQDLNNLAESAGWDADALKDSMDGFRVSFRPLRPWRREHVKAIISKFVDSFRDVIDAHPWMSIHFNIKDQEVWFRGYAVKDDPGRVEEWLQQHLAPNFPLRDNSITSIEVLTTRWRHTFSRVSGPLKFMHTDAFCVETESPTVVGSSVIAMAVGSVYAVTFAGEKLDIVDMTARVGGGSVLPRVRRHNDSHMRPLFLGGLVRYFSPRFFAQNGSVDDDSSHSIQVLEVAIALLGKIRRSAKDQGHLVFQAVGESGISHAYPIIVTSNLEVIEELNARYAHTCLTTSTRVFLLLVGHALAGECSADISHGLEHIARVRELPCLSRALSRRAR